MLFTLYPLYIMYTTLYTLYIIYNVIQCCLVNVYTTTFFMFRLIHQLLPSWSTCFFAVTLACQNNILHIFKEWTTCGLLVKMYFCLMEIKVLHLYLAGWQDLQLGLMHFCEKYFTDRARSLDGWIVFHDSINKISVANLINILRS